jgi:hypothetical protein
MSDYAIASIPTIHPETTRTLWSLQREDDHLAAWQRYGFWHPRLPEVDTWNLRPAVRALATNTGRSGWKVFRVIPITALLLALAIPATAQEPCKVNLTSATVAELALLPGVGAVTAQAIAEAKPADETALDAVKGIGPAKLAAIQPYAVYGAAKTTCTEEQKKSSKDGAQ